MSSELQTTIASRTIQAGPREFHIMPEPREHLEGTLRFELVKFGHNCFYGRVEHNGQRMHFVTDPAGGNFTPEPQRSKLLELPIDFILITHQSRPDAAHDTDVDHADPIFIEKLLETHPTAQLITNENAWENLSGIKKNPNLIRYKDRVQLLGHGDKVQSTSIPITAFETIHPPVLPKLPSPPNTSWLIGFGKKSLLIGGDYPLDEMILPQADISTINVAGAAYNTYDVVVYQRDKLPSRRSQILLAAHERVLANPNAAPLYTGQPMAEALAEYGIYFLNMEIGETYTLELASESASGVIVL